MNYFFNVVRRRKITVSRMSEPHRIRVATSIHKLHCKKFFQIGKET
ncbi:hypothetical protein LEP1GSC120_1472 [Leptospira santarosai str. 200702252]|nr:hypothetical protein LEP1GSC120_1472 [Leptospira santarosai str. 200702252]